MCRVEVDSNFYILPGILFSLMNNCELAGDNKKKKGKENAIKPVETFKMLGRLKGVFSTTDVLYALAILNSTSIAFHGHILLREFPVRLTELPSQ